MEEEPVLDLASDEYEEVIVLLAEASESVDADDNRRKRDRRLNDVIHEYEFLRNDDEAADMLLNSDDEADADFVEADNGDARALMLQHGLVNDEAADLRDAIEVLASGDWEAFLELPVIQSKLGPAFMLLEHFGVGKGTKDIKRLWRLLWQDRLHVSKTMLDSSSQCMACVNERCLGYRLSQKTTVNGVTRLETLGYMGPHCYEIRFSPLKILVEYCLLMPLYIGDDNFDDIVPRCLTVYMHDVIHANHTMNREYQHHAIKRLRQVK